MQQAGGSVTLAVLSSSLSEAFTTIRVWELSDTTLYVGKCFDDVPIYLYET
jgi:hypothetical protein